MSATHVNDANPASHVGRGHASDVGSGVRPDGEKPEAQKANSGGGVLEEREASLLPIS